MNMSRFKLFIIVCLILNFTCGCGIVQRCSYPNNVKTIELKLNRTIKIYAPKDSKIYLYRTKNINNAYNVNKSSSQSNQNFEYQGKVQEEYKVIELGRSANDTRSVSAWEDLSSEYLEINRKFWEEVWDYAAKEAEEHLVVRVIYNNNIVLQQVYQNFWGFPYKIPQLDPESASIVNSVDRSIDEINPNNIVAKFKIGYYDLIIEVEEKRF